MHSFHVVLFEYHETWMQHEEHNRRLAISLNAFKFEGKLSIPLVYVQNCASSDGNMIVNQITPIFKKIGSTKSLYWLEE